MTSFNVNAQRTYESVDGDAMQVRIYTLANGLKIYLSANQEEPRVTAHIAVNTGHRNDPAETTGLAHYLEHLMFKGSKSFGTINYEKEKSYLDQITKLYEEHYKLTDPSARKAKYHEIDSVSQIAAQYNIPNEYDKLVASIGCEGSNAYTSFDITCYTENVPSNEIENWAKIQSDRFQNLVIRGFHTELEAVYEEKNISLANDNNKQFDALMSKMFPSHSYGTQTTIGTQEHLKNPSIVNILNYYNKYYKPNNIAICMSGDLDYEKTVDIIDKYFGEWQAGNDVSPRQFPQQPILTAPVDTAVVGLEQESIMLGWRMKGAADIQNDTLKLVQNILYNNKAGLIDLNINQKMKAQGASAELFSLKDYSTIILYGAPKEGQSLDDVKSLLLGEIGKLKEGDFDENQLSAIVNNMKLEYNKDIESNATRTNMLVDSYINGGTWKDDVQQIERISKITKADVMKFAKQYLTDGYVCSRKLLGEDTNIKKIDKPEITPIPTNRELHSAFLDEIVSSTVEPIQPKFVDFNTELNFGEINSNMPFIYKQNTVNDLFSLTFRYEFGTQADNRYDIASYYQSLLGTDQLTNEDIQKKFYALACDYSINVYDDAICYTVSGLNENLDKALQLAEDVINHAKSERKIYDDMVDQILKYRDDCKKEQRICSSALKDYTLYGSYNPSTNIMTEQQLRDANPQTLLDLLKGLSSIEHTIIYYGPSSEADVASIVGRHHKTEATLSQAPVNKPYEFTTTPTNEIIIAPYDAKNIYMYKLHNENRQWNTEEDATRCLFNEYFGGGMNTIVFQELREARGLAYSAAAIYARPGKRNEPEYVLEYIISQNDKMKDCISVFNDITNNMPESESAFQLSKQNIEKSLQCRRVTKGNVINYYFTMKKLGIDYDIQESIYNALSPLTLQDIKNFENETMKNKTWRYAILGDEKELDMNYLKTIGNVKHLTLKDIFGY